MNNMIQNDTPTWSKNKTLSENALFPSILQSAHSESILGADTQIYISREIVILFIIYCYYAVFRFFALVI